MISTHESKASSISSVHIDSINNMITGKEYRQIEGRCVELYGLDVKYVDSHRFNIKSIMARKMFTFTHGLSAATRAFQLLHVLGHYHFMTSAFRKGISRFEYIYGSFEDASLHVYEEKYDRSEFKKIPDRVRIDRAAFEMGANKYAILLLDHLHMPHIKQLIKLYEPADIQYLLDITSIGRAAIVGDDPEYQKKYVCGRPLFREEPDPEGIYEPATFEVNDIEWQYLDGLNLEFHFF